MKILLSEAIAIAILAGEKTLEFYHGGVDYQLKEDLSPITQADLESNTLIVDSLKKVSSFPICTEESPITLQERKKSEHYWLVDPLDGTKDFIAKTNHFTINIALMKNDTPIFGVVYIPAIQRLYAGGEGLGFWGLAKEELQSFVLSPQWHKLVKLDYQEHSCKRFRGCDSKFHSTQEGLDYFKKHHLRKIVIGSSVKFCALSLGLVDIYPRFNGSKEWDTAAGDAILRSVGGFLYDLKTQKILQYGKEDLKNNFFIAFSPRFGDNYKDFLLL